MSDSNPCNVTKVCLLQKQSLNRCNYLIASCYYKIQEYLFSFQVGEAL